MGIFQPGLLTDFDCENFSNLTVTSAQGFVTLATIQLTVNSTTNHVWLNAYTSWHVDNASGTVTLRFVRDATVPPTALCSADAGVNQAGQPETQALSCCDTGVSPGTHTYSLQAQLTVPGTGVKTATFTMGSFQGAVINT